MPTFGPAGACDAQVTDSPASTAMRGVRVVPRLPDIAFADTCVPRLWHSGSAGITAFWNALTIAGPPVESFFLRDARRLFPLVKRPALRQEFADFMRQEAFHSLIHQRTHRLYEHWGIPVAALDAFVRRVLGWVERLSTTKLRSAMVVAAASSRCLSATVPALSSCTSRMCRSTIRTESASKPMQPGSVCGRSTLTKTSPSQMETSPCGPRQSTSATSRGAVGSEMSTIRKPS